MRLKEKQFIPFMVVGAILTMIVIVFSSFNFKQKQEEMFEENLQNSEILAQTRMRQVTGPDSLSTGDFEGQPVVLVFWASWSEKSESLLSEIQLVANERDSLAVLAALVQDAEESLPDTQAFPGFYYLDGTHLFNELKVPGIPSYVLIGDRGEVLYSNIGYQKGAGYDSLKVYLP